MYTNIYMYMYSKCPNAFNFKPHCNCTKGPSGGAISSAHLRSTSSWGNKEMGSARAVSLSGLSGLEHTPEDLLELQLPRWLQIITELRLVPLGMKEGAESKVLSLSGGILSIAICPLEKQKLLPILKEKTKTRKNDTEVCEHGRRQKKGNNSMIFVFRQGLTSVSNSHIIDTSGCLALGAVRCCGGIYVFESALQTTLELQQLDWREGWSPLNKVTSWHSVTTTNASLSSSVFINCAFAFLTPAEERTTKAKSLNGSTVTNYHSQIKLSGGHWRWV